MTGNRHRPGFTLTELLVVASVFSLLFLLGTTVFTNVQTYQRSVLAQQRLAADGRYVLEAIARSVRLGSIDYAYYRSAGIDLALPTDRIVTRDQINDQYCFYRSGTALFAGSDCTSGTPLTPDDLQVLQFSVRIKPTSDPYLAPPVSTSDCQVGATFDPDAGVCLCATSAQCQTGQTCFDPGTGSKICRNTAAQPHLTITMQTRATGGTAELQPPLRMQTTITSRLYGR